MKFYILTIFPELIENVMKESIMGRALEKNLIELEVINIRDYTEDKHLKTDDYIYGGGCGMLMNVQPIFDSFVHVLSEMNNKEVTRQEACDKINNLKRPRVILTTPQGKVFNQTYAKELSNDTDIVIICGHYEGVDQRVIDLIGCEEVSIGDFVLTGGELPALIMMDSVARLIPGVLNKEESFEDESFEDGLLEYPQYTRPEEFMGIRVPDVLLSGNHGEIAKWRKEQSIIKTKERRPDLLK